MKNLNNNLQESISKRLYPLFDASIAHNEPITDLITPIRYMVGDVLYNIVFGEPQCDDTIMKLYRDVEIALHDSGILEYLSWALYLPMGAQMERNFQNIANRNKEYLSPKLNKRKQTFDPNNIKDLLDVLILNQKQNEWDDEVIFATLMDPFNGGNHNCTSSITWTIAFLIKNPECQKKVQEEIIREIGNDKTPSYDDLPKLPYLNALIMESMRLRPSVPIALPYVCKENFVLGGYNIPKNSEVIVNLAALQRSTKYWGSDAAQFKPERFFNFDTNDMRYLPFSYGARICSGMDFSKRVIIQTIMVLCQKFDFIAESGIDFKFPNINDETILLPQTFSFCIKKRI